MLDRAIHDVLRRLQNVRWRPTSVVGVEYYYGEEEVYIYRCNAGTDKMHYVVAQGRSPEDALERMGLPFAGRTLSDGRNVDVSIAEQRLHLARVEAEYSRLLNMAKVRGLLSEIERMAYKAESDNDEIRLHQLAINIGAAARAALVGPARNCDLIANELSIDPERVPAELNKCENAPIRELIRWIFAKAEPKGGMSKPTPEESDVAAVARNVAADMRCMEIKCWKGRRMGAYAVALMLGAYASRLEDAYNRPPRKEDGAQ